MESLKYLSFIPIIFDFVTQIIEFGEIYVLYHEMTYKIFIFFLSISSKIESVAMAMHYILEVYKEKLFLFYFTLFHSVFGIKPQKTVLTSNS